MKAVIFKNPHEIEIIEKNLPILQKDEILIKIDSCGVCGTDFHIYHGLSLAKKNTILGHEFSGIIVDKGIECSNFSIGEKVAIDPNIYCGKCSYCREGKVQFCKNHKALGVTIDGGFAEFAVVPVSQAYSLPDDFPLSLASFAEPISCCIRGIDRAKIKTGENVVVVGGGAIGLIMMQLVKISGAAKVIVVEPDLNKQKLAKQLGADFVFSSSDNELIDAVKTITNGGANTSIECVGKVEAVELSIKLVRRGGKVVIFGMPPTNAKIVLNLQEAFQNELTIKTSFLNPFNFSRAIELLINNKINVAQFPVTKVTLENLAEVFKLGRQPNSFKYQFQNQ